jgi:predicted RNA methylase
MAKMMTDKKYATPFTMLHVANLLGQKSRLNKFRKAIQMVVKDGDYVVDLGTGSGILAIMAAKAGANRVSAIEINSESLDYAKKAARMNGVEHIIEFIEVSFSEFIPEHKADVVLCEMLSSMMLVEQQVPASVHAVENILKPNGLILPQEVTLYIVPVECKEIWERFQFDELQFPRVIQTTTPHVTRDLGDMKVLDSLEIMTLKNDVTIDKTLHFPIVDEGTIHGLVGVFEAKLYENIHLEMEDGWKQLFIPLAQPVEVTIGDTFSTRISYEPGKYDSLLVEIT